MMRSCQFGQIDRRRAHFGAPLKQSVLNTGRRSQTEVETGSSVRQFVISSASSVHLNVSTPFALSSPRLLNPSTESGTQSTRTTHFLFRGCVHGISQYSSPQACNSLLEVGLVGIQKFAHYSSGAQSVRLLCLRPDSRLIRLT
ncbi:unnamed protein product [Protopolystoma xenopodis]|uniref:Uncharacterized protein n=1 Tax=Protopolystoma xenopodis TaxID=117903 RepID=A0A3S4ZYP4_9PLAT|nr:unnamed protein product [Protopolystoma xenopodis]